MQNNSSDCIAILLPDVTKHISFSLRQDIRNRLKVLV